MKWQYILVEGDASLQSVVTELVPNWNISLIIKDVQKLVSMSANSAAHWLSAQSPSTLDRIN